MNMIFNPKIKTNNLFMYNIYELDVTHKKGLLHLKDEYHDKLVELEEIKVNKYNHYLEVLKDYVSFRKYEFVKNKYLISLSMV
jgi:hypothetical protein